MTRIIANFYETHLGRRGCDAVVDLAPALPGRKVYSCLLDAAAETGFQLQLVTTWEGVRDEKRRTYSDPKEYRKWDGEPTAFLSGYMILRKTIKKGFAFSREWLVGGDLGEYTQLHFYYDGISSSPADETRLTAGELRGFFAALVKSLNRVNDKVPSVDQLRYLEDRMKETGASEWRIERALVSLAQ